MDVAVDFVLILLRWGLTALMGALFNKHVLTKSQDDYFTMEFAKHLAIVAGLLVTLAWAVCAKLWSRLKVKLALQMPQNTSYAALIDAALRTVLDPPQGGRNDVTASAGPAPDHKP